MVRADTHVTTNPSDVILTRKGERYVDAHQPSLTGQGAPPAAFPLRRVPDTDRAEIERPAPRPAARRKPLRVTKARRAQIEAIVDRLLELLDVTDGDADLEPSLGAIERHPSSYGWYRTDSQGHQLAWAASGRDDREDEDEREAEPDEAWLGWTDGMRQEGRAWRRDDYGVTFDRELDDADREDGGDDEPSVVSACQRHNGMPENDLELDDGESGVADVDGLAEAIGETA